VSSVRVVEGLDEIKERQPRVLARPECVPHQQLCLERRDIVPAGGDTQYAAQRGDVMLGLLLLYEREPGDGVECVSLAKKAAAFRRMSRSSRKMRTSRRRRRISSRSSVVSPSVRRPLSQIDLLHPIAQRLMGDAQVFGNLIDRLLRVPYEANCLLPKLLRIWWPCLPHDGLLSWP
jgi:hypothetical protein